MIRTGTLAFSRTFVLVMLLAGTSAAQAQSQDQRQLSGDQWQAAGTSDRQPNFRRADTQASTWQPNRSTAQRTSVMPPQFDAPTAVAAPAKVWLTPTQAAGRKKQAQAAARNSNPPQAVARAPKPFVPPAEVEPLTAAPTSAPKPASRPRALATSQRRQPTAVNQPRELASDDVAPPAPSQSAARTHRTPASMDRVARQQPQRSSEGRTVVAERPRPTSRVSRWADDNWIRPLKQVAYQAGEPEELYAPPGASSDMPMQGEPMQGGPMQSGPMQSGPMGPEMPSDGEWIGSPDGMPYGGPYGGQCGDGECGPDCGPMCGDDMECCSTCGRGPEACYIDLAPGLHDEEACEELRFRIPRINTLMVDGGVHGFKGPFDRDRDSGNFGFQEAINMGFKFPLTDFGYQVGYQSLQSQLSGDGDTGIADAFSQHFFTFGVFRRTRDGFQGGVAWDFLDDERDTSVRFAQIRGELGFVDCGCHEVGAMINVHLRDHTFSELDDEEETVFTTYQSVDQYLLYYRMHGARGGEGRVYGGVTDDADGILGADFLLPLTDTWSLQPAFTYMIPRSSDANVAARDEAWNIGINLVWHWKGQAHSCHSSPYRPLFNVADNGTMIIDHRP